MRSSAANRAASHDHAAGYSSSPRRSSSPLSSKVAFLAMPLLARTHRKLTPMTDITARRCTHSSERAIVHPVHASSSLAAESRSSGPASGASRTPMLGTFVEP